MKVQRKISILGEWAKTKVDISNGDIITIADEGKIISGEYGERHVFKIATKNGVKNLSFNQTTMNYLIESFGEETNEWIGEKVKVWLVKSNVSGKMRDVVYLTATDWVEGDDGFYPPESKRLADKKDDIPVVEESNDEVNLEDVPF